MNPLLLLVVCALLILAVSLFGARRTRRVLGRALLAAGAVLACWVAWRVTSPPPPLASADVSPGERGLDVDLGDAAATLLVSGQVRSGRGRYELSVHADDAPAVTLQGEFERRTETRRVMKRGVVPVEVAHLERHHDLPAGHHHIVVDVVKEDGALAGPLTLRVVPRPPPELPLLVAWLVAVLIAAVGDRWRGQKDSYASIALAMMGVFSLLLLEAPHPLELGYLARMVPVALLLGAAVGGLLRTLAGLFVRAPSMAAT